ncbi:hypothetical protein ACS0TY_026022 [Phlomoides rotata]
MVCLQETKREVVNAQFCESLWPDKDFGWVYSGSCGASGGLITIWKNSKFNLHDQWRTKGALAINGVWLEEKVSINLINIYAKNDAKGQQLLWDELYDWLAIKADDLWCLCGDFNTTLDLTDRKGGSRLKVDYRSKQFFKFVLELDLVDLPLLRRKFTWYKDNGGSCSRIDRFLISVSWSKQWPNVKQSGLKRTFLDHAPIILEVSEREYWGPIPFKIVNWWLDQEDFCKTVEGVWKDTKVEGWGGYVLKEKLKKLKFDIKAWKAINGTNLVNEIENTERQLTAPDEKLETEEWGDADREERRSLLLELEGLRIKSDRMAAQKSRARWLSKEEANTSFFHAIINRNNKRSEIKCVKIDDSWLKGVNQV